MNPQFNLLDEHWIPVVFIDGRSGDVSIKELFEKAHQILRLNAPFPQTNAAVMHLLLAIMHRVFGPADKQAWKRLWVAGQVDIPTLQRYFNATRDRFYLFDPEKPFFQIRHPDVEEKPIQAVNQMIGGGDTFTLFDHTLDDDEVRLTPADAALMLLTLQKFGLAGLCHPQKKLVYKDAPCSRAAVFLVEGDNLYQTLVLNLVQYDKTTPILSQSTRPDLPVWEQDDPYSPRHVQPDGYLDYLTWPNRQAFLIRDVNCADLLVSRITLAPGPALPAEQTNPMHAYAVDKAGKLKVVGFTQGRMLWRDSLAILGTNDKNVQPPIAVTWLKSLMLEGLLENRFLNMGAYGMSTEPGKAKVYGYRGESFHFPDTLLTDDLAQAGLRSAIEKVEAARSELWGLTAGLARQFLMAGSTGDEPRQPNPDDVRKLVANWSPEDQYWLRLDQPFHIFLNGLAEDPMSALEAWNRAVRSALEAAYASAETQLGSSINALKARAINHGLVSLALNRVFPVLKEVLV